MAVLTYSLIKKLPSEEMYALAQQMRRAAISIPSNIAEGQARRTTKEFLQFLGVARASRAELETQLLLCSRVGYLASTGTSAALQLAMEVGKLLNALIAKLSTAH